VSRTKRKVSNVTLHGPIVSKIFHASNYLKKDHKLFNENALSTAVSDKEVEPIEREFDLEEFKKALIDWHTTMHISYHALKLNTNRFEIRNQQRYFTIYP
jgi:hypothetical protein